MTFLSFEAVGSSVSPASSRSLRQQELQIGALEPQSRPCLRAADLCSRACGLVQGERMPGSQTPS